MADLVNLRRHRKRIARAEKAKEAEENRVRHGLTKADKASAEAHSRQRANDADKLDALRLDGTSRNATSDMSADASTRSDLLKATTSKARHAPLIDAGKN